MAPPPSGEQFEISAGEQKATIVEVGGGIRTYEAGGRPVLESYPVDEICDGAHGAQLGPWPNRRAVGRNCCSDERFQVPGIIMFYSGRTYEYDGIEPKWRGIYDDNGRIMVAVCQNMDLGDAWEWADHPRYPERYASLAYRVGINYIIYAMTH